MIEYHDEQGIPMSPHEIAILKAAIPFLHPGIQPLLRIYLSYIDLNGCVQSLSRASFPPPGTPLIHDRDSLFVNLASLCSPQEQNLLNQVQMMESLIQMMQTMEQCNASGVSPEDAFMQMLTPEQTEQFQMLKMMMEMSSGDNSKES